MKGVHKTKHAAPPRIVIHGGEGVGKSTFASKSPNPIFVQTEDGLNGIDTNAFELATSFEMVIEQLSLLGNEQHDFKSVWVDSGDWAEALVFDMVCRSHGVQTIELAAGGYGKGYAEAVLDFRKILDWLDFLNKQRGMIVGIVCHSVVVPVNDPLTEPYDRYELKLWQNKRGRGIRDMVVEWADVVGFAHPSVVTTKMEDTTANAGRDADGNRAKVSRGIVTDKMNKLQLVGSPAAVAKNRYGLPESIDLDWNTFRNSFTQ